MSASRVKPGLTERPKGPQRRIVAVGKWVGGRWQVRTSLWRYATSYLVSSS